MVARIVGLTLLVACCSSATRTPPVRSANESSNFPQATTWKIDFQLSGGFAGLDRTLTVSSNGQLSAEDRRPGTRVTAQATQAELADLSRLVTAVKSLGEIRRSDSRCRDCLSYNIVVEIDGQRVAALLDDTTVPGSGLEELTRVLSALVNRVLSAR